MHAVERALDLIMQTDIASQLAVLNKAIAEQAKLARSMTLKRQREKAAYAVAVLMTAKREIVELDQSARAATGAS
jgi:hypothetical protein